MLTCRGCGGLQEYEGGKYENMTLLNDDGEGINGPFGFGARPKPRLGQVRVHKPAGMTQPRSVGAGAGNNFDQLSAIDTAGADNVYPRVRV